MSKFVGTGPSSYKKRIYRAAVSQRLRNTGLNRSITHDMKFYEPQNCPVLHPITRNFRAS